MSTERIIIPPQKKMEAEWLLSHEMLCTEIESYSRRVRKEPSLLSIA